MYTQYMCVAFVVSSTTTNSALFARGLRTSDASDEGSEGMIVIYQLICTRIS